MKRLLFLSLCLLVAVFTFAQTQQGYVKTKGRMVDGKLVPGQGIKGATITIQGRNAILANDEGKFSFPIPSKTFHFLEVKKNGYQLVDADIIRRSFTYSSTPIYIVMESPDQQLNDQLAAERKIRRSMQRKLEEREDEIEALKAQQKITNDEYLAALQRLYAEMENNERLIADMAKQYAQMDYDQMDELNRRISDAIVNGRLAEADSLLHSKGDLNDRINEVRREQQAESQRQKQLDLEKAELESAKVGTKKKLNDIADDCKRYFDRFKMDLQFDSAAYYIELRAELDTNDMEWQYDAAAYSRDQNRFDKAETYFLRLLHLFTPDEGVEPDENDLYLMAMSMNNLGILYSNTQRPLESEEMFENALDIYRDLAQDVPSHEANIALTLNYLAGLYYDNQIFDESEAMYLEALEINRRLVKEDPQTYEVDLTMTLNNLAILYGDTKRLAEAEAMYLETLEILRRLTHDDPGTYEPNMVLTLNNLGALYRQTQRFAEAEAMYLEALDIRRRLAKDNPQAYEPGLAMTLSNLGVLYDHTQRHSEAEALYLEALSIRRHLSEYNPKAYEPDLASSLFNMAGLYYDAGDFEKAESFILEALDIFKRLADNNPLEYNPEYASTLYSLALFYSDEKHEEKYLETRKALLTEAADIFRLLAEYNPQTHEKALTNTLLQLNHVYVQEGNAIDGYQNDLELLPLLEAQVKADKETWTEDYERVLLTITLDSFLSGHFTEAEQYARQFLAIHLDNGTTTVVLAETLLLQGRFEEAKPYFLQMKDAYGEGFLNDFNDLEEAGFIPKERKSDIERMKRLLQE
jgi:hypothetical protein